VVVPGAAGKMGRAILNVLAQTPGVVLAAAVERAGHEALGSDSGRGAGLPDNQVPLTADLAAALAAADVVIDFTTPASTVHTAELAAAARVALVVGTTGLGPDERRLLGRAAATIPVVLSPNMSAGVNVLFRLVELCAAALGDGFDVEIVEAHHRMKRDAPSGTALRLAEGVAAALGRDLDAVGTYGRRGQVGARPAAEIAVHTVRGGDVIGDHTVHFLGDGERIELTHRASSRETFARGAVRAALWVAGAGAAGRAPGLYDMRDVLGLR